jgi:hypothetical protein
MIVGGKSRRLFAFNFCCMIRINQKILRLIFVVENSLVGMFPAGDLQRLLSLAQVALL